VAPRAAAGCSSLHEWLHGMRPFRSPGLARRAPIGRSTDVAIRAISQVELVLGREGGEDSGKVLADRLPLDVEVHVELVDEAVGRKRPSPDLDQTSPETASERLKIFCQLNGRAEQDVVVEVACDRPCEVGLVECLQDPVHDP
jgi:hypothetical protein